MKRADWFQKAILLAALSLMAGFPLGAQQRRLPDHIPFPSEEPPRTPTPSQTRRLIRASYEQLQKDAAHLVELANSLQEEISKADEDVLPLSGIKKAEEIEKLAKKIQGRIKNL
ncbi:MAG: hypothetical protein HY647_09605 [Acidobacteria bacterium]|nr:hypothetical protein [Acidobacteriota bacterium]